MPGVIIVNCYGAKAYGKRTDRANDRASGESFFETDPKFAPRRSERPVSAGFENTAVVMLARVLSLHGCNTGAGSGGPGK